MKQFTSVTAILSAAVLALPLPADPLKGGSFELTGAITSGGGRATGEAFVLDGSAGQSATDTVTGGSYQLTGGVIGVYVVPGDVAVTIERLDDGHAKLTWPAEATGFLLEFTGGLGAEPIWQPVTPAPVGNTYITPFDQPLRFFRLRKP